MTRLRARLGLYLIRPWLDVEITTTRGLSKAEITDRATAVLGGRLRGLQHLEHQLRKGKRP